MRVALLGEGPLTRRLATEFHSVASVEQWEAVPRERRPVDVVCVVSGGPDDLQRVRRSGYRAVAGLSRPAEVRRALEMPAGPPAVVDASVVPGLSSLLAVHGARWLDQVDEVHVAVAGVPDLQAGKWTIFGTEWWDGEWRRRPPGTGRELVWFPEPIGLHEVRRIPGPDALLLQRLIPGVRRVSTRALWQGRLPRVRTGARPSDRQAALVVELRGRVAGTEEHVVLGLVDDRLAATAGLMAAAALEVAGLSEDAPPRCLAELAGSTRMLGLLHERGLRPARFSPERSDSGGWMGRSTQP